MTTTMYDAVPEEIGNVPSNPAAVAGYIDGRYVSYPLLVQRFPNAHHLSIAVNPAHSGARALDVETLDATASDAPYWFLHHADHAHGKPVIYTSASNVANVIAHMNPAGIPRSSYLIWSAHYERGEHICAPATCGYPQADGTQWTDTVNGRSCDQSLLSDAFFAAPARRQPHGTAHAAVSLDLARGHWTAHGTAGKVEFGDVDRWASAEIQINERTGAWRVRPLPWNSPPLGR